MIFQISCFDGVTVYILFMKMHKATSRRAVLPPYVLGKHKEGKSVEFGVESRKDMFDCVILLRPESIARGRLPWMGRREIL